MSAVYRNIAEEEFADISGRILYEDNHLLVFNKRAGEIVQGDKTEDEPLSETLKAFVAARDGKPGRVFMGVPHRLDRPVSGIVVFAKTSKALERLNEAFREGEVHKTYWALVGYMPQQQGFYEDFSPKAFLKYMFEEAQVGLIIACHMSNNPASGRVMEKADDKKTFGSKNSPKKSTGNAKKTRQKIIKRSQKNH